MTLRPEAAWIDGRWERGLVFDWEGGRITSIRASSKPPEPYWLSPAFVNAHSHLEYRHMQGEFEDQVGYWDWIRAITERKRQDIPAEVEEACLLAARENFAAGVGLIGEHSDRPGAIPALGQVGVQALGFVEILTFAASDPQEFSAAKQAESPDLLPAPHAPHTVHEEVLRSFVSPARYSMHVAETDLENAFFSAGEGPIADLYARFEIRRRIPGQRVVPYLIDLGLAHPGAQWVHVCAVTPDEIDQMAAHGVSVAHCPRSNVRLDCPPCPVRELREAGILVGIGMDSAASSGPIDMFAEMRAVRTVSKDRGNPLSEDEIWQMATEEGARTLGTYNWKIEQNSEVPLITFCPDSTDPLTATGVRRVTE